MVEGGGDARVRSGVLWGGGRCEGWDQVCWSEEGGDVRVRAGVLWGGGRCEGWNQVLKWGGGRCEGWDQVLKWGGGRCEGESGCAEVRRGEMWGWEWVWWSEEREDVRVRAGVVKWGGRRCEGEMWGWSRRGGRRMNSPKNGSIALQQLRNSSVGTPLSSSRTMSSNLTSTKQR